MKSKLNDPNFKTLLSRIKKEAFKKYNEISSKENDQQCTTLCTFNLIQNDSVVLCSLGTGTKAVGNNQLQAGYALHDCHAEVIAKRAFQVWVYKNLDNQTFFTKINNQWQILGELFVYVSQPPCGQCSLHKESLIYGLSAARPFQDFNQENIGDLDLTEYRLRSTPTKIQTLVCNRNPSFSCSDKIMLWSILGVQGCLLNRVLLPIYINSLLIDYRDNYSLRRGINVVKRSGKSRRELLQVNNKRISKQYCIRTPRVFYYKNKIFPKSPFHPSQDENNRRIKQNIQEQQYQSFSYVYIQPNQIEKINSINGQKFGIAKKDFNKIKLMPCITKIQLLNQFKNIMKIEEEISYFSEKEKNIKYRIQKNRIKELFKEWSPNKTHLEQFKI